MVWKCPPLHLPNWNNLWKWKESMRPDGNGKGDKPRPLGIPMDVFDRNFDLIFNKKKEKDESSTGHRDEQQSQQDMADGN